MDKKSNLSKIHHRIKNSIHFPLTVILIISVVIVILFAIGTKAPFGQNQGNSSINQKVTKYVELYLGFTNVTITNETLLNKIWTVNLLAYSPNGLVALKTDVNSTDLSILDMYQYVPLLSQPNTITFLNKADCSTGDKTRVDIYIDPYTPLSIRYNSNITEFLSRFSDDINVTYRIIPTFSYDSINNEANQNAVYALRYFECAKSTPQFEQFKQCFYAKYDQTQSFLNESEVLQCINESGINPTEAYNCANGEMATSALSIDQQFASIYLGSQTTPAFVFGCRYETYPLYADDAFCYLYPNLAVCNNS